ncbi:arachidonate 12-lipoxygenase [Desmophyllum pertusum]|uniref:Arachidonate 12-lipoxygenase n=1 Tax=Desmophyllum pertusum TaxID=174260 RepID=A0A9W9YIB6_9CNID|nr:arachidonate 12-lipoxygenase [Desmophyllum pertusum]
MHRLLTFLGIRFALRGRCTIVSRALESRLLLWSAVLNGCNPDTIKRCMELPLKFPVTQEMVGNLLDEGDTLQQAIKNGRVYLVDYEILDDIPQYGTLNRKLERRYTCPALGLFYVRSNGDIMQ